MWTAWPTASWWLAVGSGFSTVASVQAVVRTTSSGSPTLVSVISAALLIGSGAILSLGYLNSAIRLSAGGVRKPRRDRALLTPPKLG